MRKKALWGGLAILLLITLVRGCVCQTVPEPQETTEHQVYLPLVAKPPPDPRFAIDEYRLSQMLLLGFPDDGRFHGAQWRQPEDTDTARFMRPANRDHPSTWRECAYDTEQGHWVNEAQCRANLNSLLALRYIIVGNELLMESPIGDLGVTPEQYARWYRDALTLIGEERPDILVGIFGPIGWVSRNYLQRTWRAYKQLTGKALEVDFFPLHRYAVVEGWSIEAEVEYLTGWVGWLNQRNPSLWQWRDRHGFWLLEFGFPCWTTCVPLAESLRLMDEYTRWLKTNELEITVFAWWPSGHAGCGENTCRLVSGGQPTVLGRAWQEMAHNIWIERHYEQGQP